MIINYHPFYIENPVEAGFGRWFIWLRVDAILADFVHSLPFITNIEDFRSTGGGLRCWIDPHHDIEDAWLALYDALDKHTLKVVLSDVWTLDESEGQ